jgi:hypothetical protein
LLSNHLAIKSRGGGRNYFKTIFLTAFNSVAYVARQRITNLFAVAAEFPMSILAGAPKNLKSFSQNLMDLGVELILY